MERIEVLEFGTPWRNQNVESAQLTPVSKVDALIKRGLYREAKEELVSLLSLDTENSALLKRLGNCHKWLKEHEKSLACYRLLVRVRPLPENQCLLAENYLELGELTKAKEIYLHILSDLKINEEIQFEANKNLGNIELRVGDFDAAEERYNKAYRINPQSDVLYVNYGTLEVQKGNYQEALQRYRKAVQMNPENDKAWVGLGLMHRECGDFELAWANIEMALDIDNTNETALGVLIDWGFKQNQLNRVIARIKSMILRRPMNEVLRKSMSQIQSHMGFVEAAAQILPPRQVDQLSLQEI